TANAFERLKIKLNWNPNPERDLDYYNIYRSEDSLTGYQLLSGGYKDTSFVDSTVQSGVEYYYYSVTAVDTNGNESQMSNVARSFVFTFDQGIVVVDETRGGRFSFVNSDSVNAFYQRALLGYDWSYIDHSDINRNYGDSLTLKELSPYQVAIVHSEDLRGNRPLGNTYYNNTYSILSLYLKAGGKVIIEGRKNLVDGTEQCGYFYECLRDSSELQSFIRENLHIKQAFIPLWNEIEENRSEEFIGAFSQIAEYPELEADSIRLDQCIGSSKVLTLNGKVPGVGWFMPDDSAEVIYTFNSAYDTSQQEGKPVALRYLGSDYSLVYFDFPLYFIKEGQATQLLHQALSDLGESTGVMKPLEVEDDQKTSLPSEFGLAQNYPNPFNLESNIEYSLPKDCQVKLVIYNILGQKIRTLVNEEQKAGHQRISWDGRNDKGEGISSGIYFYRIKAGDFIQTKRMMLLK
ncbi:MAG: T9SS type A sorting domain-containing protein, partial [candidate division Zixibacteria bacterium]|nr:T9SS type A sorting domain-containing protein [candidate division Zixibacteria bacterium]